MVLSKRCEYALRTLIDIGLVQRSGRARVSLAELAAHERIPEAFLAQPNEAGILGSRRGPGGGRAFARPLDELRPGDVVRLMDGPLTPVRCVSESDYERCTCPDEVHCGLRMLMLDVRNAISSVLDRHTLDEVVDLTLRFLRRDGVPLPLADLEDDAREV